MKTEIEKLKESQKKSEAMFKRWQKTREMREKIIDFLKKSEDPTIAELQKAFEIPRSSLIHWIRVLEKDGWIKRQRKIDSQGRPTILTLNEKAIAWQEHVRRKNKEWESFEERQLFTILTEKILKEIDQKQPNQHKKLVEVFKQFGETSYGARMIFLLYGDYVKINYNLTLTEKGEKALRRIKKRKNLI